ncbi:hypothetical protein [Novosphingobium lentum]|uniref:hypothetical protein n=1 Tax=Novosphingobium lentum TaxID=145287 RepID=UPI00082B9973|nr:hypothetical protein [Novosphingobium lentum]
MRRIVAAGLLLAGSLWPVAALAGPPFETDDPQPTDTGHWEIYGFAATEGVGVENQTRTGFDLNYGPLPDVQLTATLPLEFDRDDQGQTTRGVGDVELGVKLRLLHQDKGGIDLAIFPRAILPSSGHRFGSGKVAALLPVWAQRDFGSWSVFGGGGYAINPGAGNRDYWSGGIAVTHDVTSNILLGIEAQRQGSDTQGGVGSTLLGLGGIVKLGEPFSLLFAGGPRLPDHGTVAYHGYAAIGVNF